MRDCNFLKPVALAPDALAGDEAEPRRAGFERGNQRRNEGRIVLAVAVERHHDGRTRRRDAGAHRRRLAAGLRVADLPQPRMLRHQAAQFLLGGVARAVIDIDDLERAALQRGGDLGDQRRDIAGLVAHRHDHGYCGIFGPLLCGIVLEDIVLKDMPEASKAHPERVQPVEIPGFLRKTSRSAALIRRNEGHGKARRSSRKTTAGAPRTSAAPKRAQRTDQRAGDDVARMVRQHDDAAEHDDERIEPHHGAAAGQSAPIAIAADAAVVAWPDGMLAYSGGQMNGR